MKTLACGVLAALSLGGCSQSTVDIAAETAALRAAADAYHQAGEQLDFDGFAAAYASDGLILPPNVAAVTGRDGAREYISTFADLSEASVSFSNMTVNVAASGDMGYTLADATIVFEGPDGLPVEDTVRDFHLWVKENGDWKISIDLWNSERPPTVAGGDAASPVADALSAAWPGMMAGATVVDWDGNVLQEGSNRYTCMPTPPMLSGTAPMCMDKEWMTWAGAWQNKEDYAAETIGISYMLRGDEGASNIDPYAEGPTEDNEWIVEGPHLMIVAPVRLLESFPTDPDNGGPYVMWKGTPYAHLMVPVGARN